MKFKFAAPLLGALLLSLSGVSHAQFGGLTKSIPGLGGDSGSSSVSPETIVQKYVAGADSVNSADVKLLRAVGLKEDADRAELHAKNLTAGATKDSLEESAKSQTESSKALEQVLTSGKVKMDAKSKELFTAGLVDLGKGIIQYASMSKDVSNFKPGPTAIGGSLSSAVMIVKNLPDSLKTLIGTLKSSIAFAKSNNIPVPKEAADATSAI